MYRRLKFALIAALASVALHTDSSAATATGNLTITVGIGTTCTINPIGYLLGSYTNTTTAITGAVYAQAVCSNGLPYWLDLNGGLNPTAGFTSRQLASGTNRLAYNLYTTNAYTTVWGSGMAGGTTQLFTGSGTAQSQPAYFQIPATTTPPTGTYSDTVIITATF